MLRCYIFMGIVTKKRPSRQARRLPNIHNNNLHSLALHLHNLLVSPARDPAFYCCGLYTIPPTRPYTSPLTGPAHLLLSSSRPLTSLSFCTTVQQQQQHPLSKSPPTPPSILYALLILVRCRAGNRAPRPHATVISRQWPLTDEWPSMSVGSFLADFCDRR